MPPAPQDDQRLIELEEKIFEEWNAAHALDPEIIRLAEIWHAEGRRLATEVDQGRCTLSPDERWRLVGEMPECKEHDRLLKLQDEPYARMDAFVNEMFATPARTPEGRRAKAIVLLSVIMGDEWSRVEKETDYPERMARNLLIEFVGGEPGDRLRDQFA
jgi:hypothetical protein